MANGNGKGGRVKMGGTLIVSGPDIIERLAAGESVRFEEEHIEFDLRVKPGAVRKLEAFSPLVWFEDADVTITNDAMEHGGEIGRDVAIFITGADGKSVGFNVTATQVEALLRVLSSFVAASKACDELEQGLTVKAAPSAEA